MKSRKIIGIVAIIAALLMACGLITFNILQTLAQDTVIVTKTSINAGEQITEDMITEIKMSVNDINEFYYTEKEDVVGKFATVDIVSNDILTTFKLADTATSSDNQYLSIPSGKQAISFSVEGGADSLSNKLNSGDIIRIYTYTGNDENPVEAPESLRFVRVASITSSDYQDVDENKKDNASDETSSYTTITVIVSGQQAEDIIKIQNEKGAYITLISRGNEDLANKLLAQQETMLAE